MKDDAIHAPGGATHTIAEMQNQLLNDQVKDGFEVVKKLGQGGFGTVYLCRRTTEVPRGDRRRTPEYFALKELSSPVTFKPGRDQDIKKCLPLTEAALQQYMKHEAIVETYWADVLCLDPKTNKPLQISARRLAWTSLDDIQDLEATYHGSSAFDLPDEVKLQMRIAMEVCDLGSMTDYLVNPLKQTPSTLAQQIAWKHSQEEFVDRTRCSLLTCLDIAEALKFMHKSKTLHGDLKPHNILLVTDSQDEKKFRAKISDFGLSHHMADGQTHVDISQGTEAYLPKEVFEEFKITEATDVYSLGLLMWEIFYGIFWFSVYDAEKKRKGVKFAKDMGGYRPSCTKSCPPLFTNVVHACLAPLPEDRPTAGYVVKEIISCLDELSA